MADCTGEVLFVDSMSDAKLRSKLAEHGFPNVPITGSTRKLLANKLKQLLSEKGNVRNRMDFRGYAGQLVHPSGTAMADCTGEVLFVDSMSDAKLRSKLAEHGFPNVPITGSTRKLLANKLKQLLSEKGNVRNRMDFRGYAGQLVHPSERMCERELASGSDAKIQDMLCQHGYPVMPITATTRGFYLRLLKRFPPGDTVVKKFGVTAASHLANVRRGSGHRYNGERYEPATFWGNNESDFELNFAPLRVLNVPRCNREQHNMQYQPASNRGTNERALERNFEALQLVGGVAIGNRESSELPIVRVNGARAPELTFLPLGMPLRYRELNEPATVQANEERPLQRNISFGEFLNTAIPRLDLGPGVVINNSDTPVVQAVEVAAKPEVVPPRPQTSPALKPSRLQCKICLDNDTSMVLIPCGHMICGDCRPNVSSCPFCRAAIVGDQKFFN